MAVCAQSSERFGQKRRRRHIRFMQDSEPERLLQLLGVRRSAEMLYRVLGFTGVMSLALASQ